MVVNATFIGKSETVNIVARSAVLFLGSIVMLPKVVVGASSYSVFLH
jgi:hypothetical protein